MGALKALFFDQDGLIIDSERDGHRVAFNKAFREFQIGCEWSVERYRDLLRISGGKERLRQFFRQEGIALSGDIVPQKKPAPDICLLALEKTGLKLRDTTSAGPYLPLGVYEDRHAITGC